MNPVQESLKGLKHGIRLHDLLKSMQSWLTQIS